MIAGIILTPISPPMMAKGIEIQVPTAPRIVDDVRPKAINIKPAVKLGV